jgi:hypothetical protein
MRDYLQDENNDLVLVNGDFKITESTQQHQKDLLISRKCDYKLKLVGVDIYSALLDDDQENLPGTIRKEFTNDGMTVNSISLDNGKLKIDAPYETDNNS